MTDAQNLLPISEKDRETKSLLHFRISVSSIFLVGFSVPPILFSFTILWTLVDDYEGSTYTHCNVLHLIPSLSVVIHSTQEYWILASWFEFPFRLLAASFYWRYQHRLLPVGNILITTLFLLFYVQNNMSFIIMSEFAQITGTDMIHVMPVLSALFSGIIYLGIGAYSLWFCEHKLLDPHEQLSFELKRQFIICGFPAATIMWAFYFMHALFCLPLAYTCFTVCEYIVALSNMGYVWTAYLDFYNIYVCFDLKKGIYVMEL